MATEQFLGVFNDLMSKLDAFKKERLISRKEWGAINFEQAKGDYDKIFETIGYLNSLPVDQLIDPVLKVINDSLTTLVRTLEENDQFSIEEADPSGSRNALIAKTHQESDKLFSASAPWIPFLAYQKGDIAGNINTLAKAIKDSAEMLDQAKKEIEAKNLEIDKIVTKAREASAGAGAAVFTKDFLDESVKLEKKSNIWLLVTGALGLVTISLSIITFFWTQAGLDQGQAIQALGSKFITIGVLITGTLWCGKIYKALKHQATINNHRALSLQTFQAFTHAASDEQTKNAVLLESTRAIFANTLTGFIDSKGSSSDSDSRFIEIAKFISGEKT